jgi:uncharacterized protein YdhG (YjbR/CyaY superfamily)
MSPVASVDEYLANVPAEMRSTLDELRTTIKAVAPEASESISYGMVGYKYRGQPLIYFGAWKRHCAIYGFSVSALPDELSGYEESGKGTIRFTPQKPLPAAVVEKLLRARMAEIATEEKRGD